MSEANHKNIVVVGAGIIGTSVATMLSKVSPNWHIDMFERLEGAGIESSNENNNAGTGHAALCELNYTVEQDDGSIDASKAQEINEQFELSRQFWGNLVKNGDISNPEEFIQPLPHISFVMGPTNVNFLRKRYETLRTLPMFDTIEYTEDMETMRKWMPLMMENREPGHQMAASKIDEGTDVNYGALTRKLAHYLEQKSNVSLKYKTIKDCFTHYRSNYVSHYFSIISIESIVISCKGLSCGPTFVAAISSNVDSPSNN